MPDKVHWRPPPGAMATQKHWGGRGTLGHTLRAGPHPKPRMGCCEISVEKHRPRLCSSGPPRKLATAPPTGFLCTTPPLRRTAKHTRTHRLSWLCGCERFLRKGTQLQQNWGLCPTVLQRYQMHSNQTRHFQWLPPRLIPNIFQLSPLQNTL